MKTKYDWKEIQEYYDAGHSWRELTDKFGMTCETINRARRRGDFISTRTSSEGQTLAKSKGRGCLSHSQETKDKLSAIRTKYLTENPDKVPYLLNHYSNGPSYPEEYFAGIFTDLVRYHRIGLYELDFADIEQKIDLEVDGDQHYLDERIAESDIRRTAFLEEQGWTVIRIKWSDYQKLSSEEKIKYVAHIKEQLGM